jgi:hypothetical protein
LPEYYHDYERRQDFSAEIITYRQEQQELAHKLDFLSVRKQTLPVAIALNHDYSA